MVHAHSWDAPAAAAQGFLHDPSLMDASDQGALHQDAAVAVAFLGPLDPFLEVQRQDVDIDKA